MPALTQVDVEKVVQGEYWVNRYHLSTAIADSGAAVGAIIAAEVAVHFADTLFTKASMRTTTEDDEVYGTVIINQNGARTSELSNARIPLFVVARVDFGAIVGRPSRKYLRNVLSEGGMGGYNVIDSGVLALLQTYANAILAVAGICDVDGDELISGVPSPLATNRQLRRGSKKNVTPSGGGVVV